MSRLIELGVAVAISAGAALVNEGSRSTSKVAFADPCRPHRIYMPFVGQPEILREPTPTPGGVRVRTPRNGSVFVCNRNRLNPIQTAVVETSEPYPTVRRGDIGAPTIVVGNPAPTNTPTP